MDSKETKRKILIQRHVQSVFNQRMEDWQRANNTSEENYEIKTHMDEPLLDANITEIGLAQAKEASKTLANYPNIKYIYTSPLRRCILTMVHSFADYEMSGVKSITASDAFRERLDSNCDIPDKTRKLREEFKEIDFSFMDKFPIPDIWFVYTMPERHQREFATLGEETMAKTKSGEETRYAIVSAVADKLQKLLPEFFENFFDMQPRARNARQYIAEEIMKREKELGRKLEDNEFMVVSHSSFIKQLTSTQYDEKTGNGVDGKWLQNGQIIEFEVDLKSSGLCVEAQA